MRLPFTLVFFLLHSIVYTQTPIQNPQKWDLIFSDDFTNTNTISGNNKIWETGFPYGQIGADSPNELSYPTRFDKDFSTSCTKGGLNHNIINNNLLRISAKIEPGYYEINRYNNQGVLTKTCDHFKYTTGMLYSKDQFQYGYYSIRCAVPNNGQLFTPSFWLYDGGGNDYREIDIFEFGNDKSNIQGTNIHISRALDNNLKNNPGGCWKDQPINCYPKDIPLSFDVTKHYHDYGLLWEQNHIAWYVDGKLIREEKKHSPAMPMHIIVTMSVPSWNKDKVKANQFPVNLDIDYIKVFKKKPEYKVYLNRHHGDFNGDGKTDLLYFGENATAVSLNTGSRFLFANWQIAKRGIFDFWTVGDFNGDGKDDVLNSYGTEGVKVFLSDGKSFLSGTVWTKYGVAAEKFWTAGDFNGDGKDDILRTEAGIGVQILLSNGTGFQNPVTWTTTGYGTEGFWTIGDYNGDGKDDILETYNGVVQVLLSTGSSFQTVTNWSVGQTYGQIEKSWRVGDFNNDGKEDILRTKFGSGEVEVLLSTGKSFGFPQKWTNKLDITSSTVLSGDFNGDKYTDIFYIDRASHSICLSNGNKFSAPEKWN